MEIYATTSFALDPMSAGGIGRFYGLTRGAEGTGLLILDLLLPRSMAPHFTRLALGSSLQWGLVLDTAQTDHVILEFMGSPTEVAAVQKMARGRKFRRLVDYDRSQTSPSSRRLR